MMMKRYLLFTFSVVCFFTVGAQNNNNNSNTNTSNNRIGITPAKPKPQTREFKKHFAVASSFSYSVINNRKELRGQYKPGVNVNLDFYTRPWFYWSAEYTYFFVHKSSPGLADINSWNTELNGNLLMGAATSDLEFRFIFGVSYLDWRGTYVGPDVVDDKTWYIGKIIYQDWIAANFGVGFFHPIGKRFNGYADFRLRFASQAKDLVSISDTAFNFGIQFNPYGVDSKKRSNSAHPSRIYRWLKKRAG